LHKMAAVLGILLFVTALTVPFDRLVGAEAKNSQAFNDNKGVLSLIEPPVVSLTERFDQAVNEWIIQLSKQSEFKSWGKADWRREPLGPGMHGWIVLLSVKGKEVGYLVVGAKPDGQFILTEYGAGEYPLFSENTLYRSLVQQELIASSMTFEQFIQSETIREAHYYAPFANIWSITLSGDDYWVDGKTGELLPLNAKLLSGLQQQLDTDIDRSEVNSTPFTSQLAHTLTLPDFDPYFSLSWLKAEPLIIKDLQQLQTLLKEQTKLIYVTEPYEQTVLFAFPVTGYHEWCEGEPYLRVEHNGSRYVRAISMLQRGRFHQIPSPSYP